MTVFLVGTGTNAPGIGALSFGNSQSQSSGTVYFQNGNGVSWGLSSGVVTASVLGINAINLSAGSTSSNASQIIFSNATSTSVSSVANVTFGLSGNVITALAAYGGGGSGAPTYLVVVTDNAPGTNTPTTGYAPTGWQAGVTLLKVRASTGGTTIVSMVMTGFTIGASFVIRNTSPTDQLIFPNTGSTGGAAFISPGAGTGIAIPPLGAGLVLYDSDGLVFIG